MRITPACSKRASTVTSEAASSAPVWELLARCAGRRAAALHDDDRLLAATRRATREKRRGIAERLDVEQRHVGVAGPPPSTRGSRCAVMSALLPTETNEDTPRPRSPAQLHQGEPESPALRDEADVSRRAACAGAKVAFSRTLGAGVQDAEAVGPDQSHAGRSADLDAARAASSAPSGAGLGEAGRDHDQRRHALVARTRAATRSPPGAGTAITARSTGRRARSATLG